jgi:hypothetical protein
MLSYSNDEKSNLSTMIVVLKLKVNCETLGVTESFQGTCFGHAFEVLLICNCRKNSVQRFEIFFHQIYPCIFANSIQEWTKACKFVSEVNIFQEVLQFKKIILLYYSK